MAAAESRSMKIATRRNMGKITQFRGWFSSIFLNVESSTAPIEGSRTSQQIRVRRYVETVRLIHFEAILLNKITSTNNQSHRLTQWPTCVCWLVLEPSIGAVGLSTLRNMLETTPWIAWFCPYSSIVPFLSFFLGFRRPNLITGLSEWRTPD